MGEGGGIHPLLYFWGLKVKFYFPLKINYHKLKWQFYLDIHGASQMSEMLECMPHCFVHLPVTVVVLCGWQSQLTPYATVSYIHKIRAGICNTLGLQKVVCPCKGLVSEENDWNFVSEGKWLQQQGSRFNEVLMLRGPLY